MAVVGGVMTRPLIESGDITTTTGTGTTGALDHPAYGDGDLIIAFIGLDDDFSANNLQTPSTGPNGETLILDTTGSGGSSSSGPTQGAVAWVGTASESAGTVDFTWSGSEFFAGRVIKVLAGEFDSTTPLGALSGYSGNTSSSATTIATPSWALDSDDGGGAIVVHMVTDADPITGNPSGWTITVNTDHGGVASAITQRDADSVDSETVASVDYTIASDSSSTLGIVVRPPGVTHTADGSPSIILPTAAGTAEVIHTANSKSAAGGFPTESQSTNTNAPSAVSSYTANYPPSAIAADDLLVFFIMADTVDAAPTITVGTALLDTGSSSTLSNAIYYRKATGSEGGGTFTVTHPTSAKGTIQVLHYTNWDDAVPPEISARTSGDSTAPDSADLNPAGWGTEDTKWISFKAQDTTSITNDPPTNYSTFFSASMTLAGRMDGADRDLNAASENPGPWNINSMPWQAWTLAIKGPVGGIGLAITLPTAAGTASVDTGTHTADGSPSITLPTAAGTTDIERNATGSPSITLPTAAGVATIIKKATGAAAIALITAAGVAEILNTASGAPEIPLPTAAGTATVTAGIITANGSPEIAIPTAAGTAEIIKTADGSPSITLPTAAGVAEINNTASGAPEIPLPTAAGTASVAFAAKDTSVRVTFATPAVAPLVGAGLQRFRLRLRRDAAHVGGSGIPTVNVALYEDGIFREFLATSVAITADDPGQIIEAQWNASSLVTAADGSAVECLMESTANGSGADRRAVEVGAIEWCTVAAGGNFANGAPAIPLPTAAGTTAIDRSASGAPTITLPVAAGVAEIIKTASGAPEIAIPTAAGVARIVTFATGAPEIPLPAAAGVAQITKTANGSPAIPLPTAAGTTDIERTATGAPSIPLPTAAGVAFIGVTANGAPDIALPTAAGVAEIIKTADGSPSIPLPTAAGVAEIANTASGAPEIPLPTAAGVATFVKTATGAPEIALPTAAGVAEVGNIASGAPSIPLPTAAGTTALTRFANGAPSIPLPTAAGVAQVGDVVDEDVGGGRHGAVILPVRQREPEQDEPIDQSVYDDAELALLAVKVIEEFYE